MHDTADVERYLETFVSESWGEHMRQHVRATIADRRIEARPSLSPGAERAPGVPPRTCAGRGREAHRRVIAMCAKLCIFGTVRTN
ncbi:MAG: MFS transporter [Gemmatimonadales bacterium]|nr:MFS transporter [Gemmatimonadales bacterium]